MTNHYYDKDNHDEIKDFFGQHKFRVIPENDIDHVLDALEPNDIIFAHVDNRSSWISLACNNSGVDIVFMSTQVGGAAPPDPGDPKNVHACRYPARALENNKRVNSFFSFLQSTDERRWELLAPEPYPEYSVAAYLLMVAKSKGVEFSQDILGNIEVGEGETFWQAVEKELTEKKAEADGLPSNWDAFLNPEFDYKICQEALRKSFPATSI